MISPCSGPAYAAILPISALLFAARWAWPARYVSAYAWRLEPPDFHGVFEAYLRGPSGFGWYMFDPTRMADPRGIVRIGIGRDGR